MRRHRIHRLPPREDVERELRLHLEGRTEELIAAGWDAVAARAEAQRLFGDYAAIRSECDEIAVRHSRTRRRWRMWSELRQDMKYAARGLAREPGFALLAIITLALGIGANSAAFAIVNGVLLAPLPYPDPDRLVAVWEVSERGNEMAVAWPNFHDFRRSSGTLASMGAYQNPVAATVLGGTGGVRAPVARVTASVFDVLQVEPARGRGFHAAEMFPGGPVVVLVSDAFWREQLGAPTDLSDVTITAGPVTAQVIGVMPRDFDFPRGTHIWAPLDIEDPAGHGTRTAHNFRVIGRLAHGVTIEQAQQELNLLTQSIREAEPDIDAVAMSVNDLRDDSVGGARRALLILLGASTFVLLVACTNLASALLGRAARRRHELAVRASLGAERLRLVRQLLTESLLLALLGAVAGLALAAALIQVVAALGADAIPRLQDVRLDGWVLAFTTTVAVATALLFGTLPALRATSTTQYDAVREGGRGTETTGQRRSRLLRVGAEVALALLLLVGSGLLVRSFQQLTSVDVGFEIDDQLAVEISLPAGRYANGDARTRFYDNLLERVRALPGVEQAAITMYVPLASFDPNGLFDIEGGEIGDGDAAYRVVSDGFFETMGTPIVRGRGFTRADRAGAEDVIIINERLAAQYFPGEDPIGRRMRTGGMDSRGLDFATIIGIVGDVRTRGFDVPGGPAYYLAYPQRTDRILSSTLLVRGAIPSRRLADPVRAEVRAIDADVAIEMTTLDDAVGAALADRRFMIFVLGAFAATALLLAAVGIYAVVASAIAERTREIGIRMALGAHARSVLWSVSRSTLISVTAGVGIGLIGAVWLSRLITSLLFDVEPIDPLTFVAVVLLLFVTACLAMIVPARRALSLSPLAALRIE